MAVCPALAPHVSRLENLVYLVRLDVKRLTVHASRPDIIHITSVEEVLDSVGKLFPEHLAGFLQHACGNSAGWFDAYVVDQDDVNLWLFVLTIPPEEALAMSIFFFQPHGIVELFDISLGRLSLCSETE